MGHEKISILDGGLPRWTHEGYELDTVDLSSKSEGGEVLSAEKIEVRRIPSLWDPVR